MKPAICCMIWAICFIAALPALAQDADPAPITAVDLKRVGYATPSTAQWPGQTSYTDTVRYTDGAMAIAPDGSTWFTNHAHGNTVAPFERIPDLLSSDWNKPTVLKQTGPWRDPTNGNRSRSMGGNQTYARGLGIDEYGRVWWAIQIHYQASGIPAPGLFVDDMPVYAVDPEGRTIWAPHIDGPLILDPPQAWRDKFDCDAFIVAPWTEAHVGHTFGPSLYAFKKPAPGELKPSIQRHLINRDNSTGGSITVTVGEKTTTFPHNASRASLANIARDTGIDLFGSLENGTSQLFLTAPIDVDVAIDVSSVEGNKPALYRTDCAEIVFKRLLYHGPFDTINNTSKWYPNWGPRSHMHCAGIVGDYAFFLGQIEHGLWWYDNNSDDFGAWILPDGSEAYHYLGIYTLMPKGAQAPPHDGVRQTLTADQTTSPRFDVTLLPGHIQKPDGSWFPEGHILKAGTVLGPGYTIVDPTTIDVARARELDYSTNPSPKDIPRLIEHRGFHSAFGRRLTLIAYPISEIEKIQSGEIGSWGAKPAAEIPLNDLVLPAYSLSASELGGAITPDKRIVLSIQGTERRPWLAVIQLADWIVKGTSPEPMPDPDPDPEPTPDVDALAELKAKVDELAAHQAALQADVDAAQQSADDAHRRLDATTLTIPD